MNNIRLVSDLAALGVICLLSLGLLHWQYRSERVAWLTMESSKVRLPHAGVHAVERFPESSRAYRWTSGPALFELPNPGGTPIVRLLLVGGPERSLPVTLGAGDLRFSLEVDQHRRIYQLALPPAASAQVALTIDSPTMMADQRTLGVIVSDITIAGGGTVPPAVAAALAFAASALFLLLRQAGLAWLPAGGAAVLSIGLFAPWQATHGWQLSSIVPALLFMGTTLGAVVLFNRLRRDTLTRAAHPSGAADTRALMRLFWPLLIGATLACHALYFLTPDLRLQLLRENGLLEGPSNFFYLGSLLLGLLALTHAQRLIDLMLSAAIALAGLVCFLDEVAFGTELFEVPLPLIFGYPVDGLHDFIDIAAGALLADPASIGRVGLGVGAALALGLATGWLLRARLRAAWQTLRPEPAWRFLVAFVLLLIVAMTIDLDMIGGLYLQFLEELFEMNAGIALLFAALAAERGQVTRMPGVEAHRTTRTQEIREETHAPDIHPTR